MSTSPIPIEATWFLIAMGLFAFLTIVSIGIFLLCFGKAVEFVARSIKPKKQKDGEKPQI